MIELDASFRERNVRVFGDDALAWFDRLPSLIAEYAGRWRLTVDRPYPFGYNYVAPATRADGTRVVLKAGVPRHDIKFETAALRHYDGNGAVRLLEADDDAGVFLLERIEPGNPLIELEDDAEATRIAAGVMRQLWRPPPQGCTLPTIADWGRAFGEFRARHGGGSRPLPQIVCERGQALYADLASTQEGPVVLHGDLHHWNVLAAQRQPWLAIDPHGLIGEPAFDVGSWMRNPVGDPGDPGEGRFLLRQPDVRNILTRRLAIFEEELAIDRERLRQWSIAFAVLSACWSDESGHIDGWQQAVAVAEHLIAIGSAADIL